ncbi:short chain dehydrogenase [Chitinophaga oryzae]|uniref:Short chain dehydrogenase n=1 Tax=Chitinophaga oryzae TaxID=2725414 RepID=A0AAE7D764_9BACT|nr:short chain dehydrogenase [Chitinophaga oryzae]QJB31393.1 short chain dehydrogenase [Chitinophaga oryzae]QJB37878.1 short chain dehydrogenase [Chitinophaga oryzae]
MKILMIGTTGAIGARVRQALTERHEVIAAGRNSGDVRVDITDEASIEQLYKTVGNIDAVVVTAGSSGMESFQRLQAADVMTAVQSKLMGQVNVVLKGQHHLNDNGSFTLTSGILADEPARDTVAGAIVSGAVNSFVMAAATELRRGIRINAVSPGLAADSADAIGHLFPGFHPVPMSRLVTAYRRCIEGVITGQVVRVHG